MPASSELPIYAIESAVMFAARDILINVVDLPADSVRLEGDYERLPDEVCIVEFTDYGALGRENEYSGGPGWPADATEYIRGTGQLAIRYRLPKTANTPSASLGVYRAIDEISAQIRSAFAMHNQHFTAGRLPYHAITDILRQAPSRGVDTANDRECQVIVERFLLTYEILPTSWPAAS